MKKFMVKLDIVFLDCHEVEAETEAEAIKIAENLSDHKSNIAGVFEVEDLGQAE